MAKVAEADKKASKAARKVANRAKRAEELKKRGVAKILKGAKAKLIVHDAVTGESRVIGEFTDLNYGVMPALDLSKVHELGPMRNYPDFSKPITMTGTLTWGGRRKPKKQGGGTVNLKALKRSIKKAA